MHGPIGAVCGCTCKQVFTHHMRVCRGVFFAAGSVFVCVNSCFLLDTVLEPPHLFSPLRRSDQYKYSENLMPVVTCCSVVRKQTKSERAYYFTACYVTILLWFTLGQCSS